MNNKILYAIAVLIIIFGAAWYFFGLIESTPWLVGQNQNNKKEIPKAPNLSKFIFGIVSKIDDKIIVLKVGKEETNVLTDDKTVIEKQIKDNMEFKKIFVDLSQIKSEMKILVYPRPDSGAVYIADKIQILASF